MYILENDNKDLPELLRVTITQVCSIHKSMTLHIVMLYDIPKHSLL